MVLEDESLVVLAQGIGDVVSLLLSKDDTAKVLVEGALAVEGAAVLGGHLDVAAESAEGLAMDGVAVARGVRVGTGCVDGVVARGKARMIRATEELKEHVSNDMYAS